MSKEVLRGGGDEEATIGEVSQILGLNRERGQGVVSKLLLTVRLTGWAIRLKKMQCTAKIT